MITSLSHESAARMDDFASSFSCLDGVPGTCPFEVGALVGWLSKVDGYKNPDATAAAGFLLWLYARRETHSEEPEIGPSGTDRAARARAQSLGDSFHLLFALRPGVSIATRARFAAWILFPWFPEGPT
jgi:hypothetical protein